MYGHKGSIVQHSVSHYDRPSQRRPCAPSRGTDGEHRPSRARCRPTGPATKEAMIDKHEEAAREAAAEGAQVMCFQELFYGPYFCQVQDTEYYDYTEPIPDGPTTQRFQSRRQGARHGAWCCRCTRSSRPALYYNTAAVIDADGTLPRQVPQAAHPAGQGLLGEVLLPARQRRVPDLRHRGRQGRRVHLLRPPLPRGLAGARPQRRRDRVQPVGHQPRPVGVHLALEQPAAAVANMYYVGAINRVGIEAARRQRLLRPELLRRPRGQVRRRRRRRLQARADRPRPRHGQDQEVRDRWAFYRDRRPDAYDELVGGDERRWPRP